MDHREGEDRLEQVEGPAAIVMWGIARVFVGLFAMAVLLLGGVCGVGFFQAAGWMLGPFSVALILFGGWLLWAAIWGPRRVTDHLVSEFLLKILDHLF